MYRLQLFDDTLLPFAPFQAKYSFLQVVFNMLGMRRGAHLLFQLVIFADLQLGAFNFLDLKIENAGHARLFAFVMLQLPRLLAQGAPRAVHFVIPAPLLLQLRRQRIQYADVVGRVKDEAVVELAVYVEKVFANALDDGSRHQRAVHQRCAPAAAVKLPADDKLPVVALDVVFFQQTGQMFAYNRKKERAFNTKGVRALPHERC